VNSPALEKGLELVLFLQHTLPQLPLPQQAARKATGAAAPVLSVRSFTSRNTHREKAPNSLVCPIYPFVCKGWRFPGKRFRTINQISPFTPPPSALTGQGRVVGPAQYA